MQICFCYSNRTYVTIDLPDDHPAVVKALEDGPPDRIIIWKNPKIDLAKMDYFPEDKADTPAITYNHQ